MQRLQQLGNADPGKCLFGCEIDPAVAKQSIEDKLGLTWAERQFIIGDFLALKPSEYIRTSFDCLVGNPPYVSHHNMPSDQKETAQALVIPGVSLDRKASLWAYFVVHGTSFLSDRARAAWILPHSFLYAGYAKAVQEHLMQNFRRVGAIEVGSKIFAAQGASDGRIVVLCDERLSRPSSRPSSLETYFVADLDGLDRALAAWSENEPAERGRSARPPMVSSTAQSGSDFAKAITMPGVAQLGTVAEIRLGLVTGANKMYVIPPSLARTHNLPQTALRPLVSRARDVPGVMLNDESMQELRNRDVPCWLFSATRAQRREVPTIDRYVRRISREYGAKNRSTFRKRDPWYHVDFGDVPSAFLVYMSTVGPRLVINTTSAGSTNTLHNVYFAEQRDDLWQQAVAVSFQSSLSQLSAEMIGRRYPGGLLKHELSDSRRIDVALPLGDLPRPAVREAVRKVDHLVRCRAQVAAMVAADAFVVDVLGHARLRSVLPLLQSELTRLRSLRMAAT